MGAVTAAGFGVDALWNAARDGVSGVGPIRLNRPYPTRVPIAAQVPDFDPAEKITDIPLAHLDRFSQLALIAGEEAVASSGIDPAQLRGFRTASIIGTGIGGIGTVDDGLHMLYTTGGRADPLTIPRLMANAAACNISMRYGAMGPTFAVSSACSSSSQAVGLAMQMVRSGMIDRAIVGGTEALIFPGPYRTWEAMRVMTPNACRPFSKDRNGMTLGEGAAVMILESEAALAARGGTPLAEIAGYGTTSDAKDIIRPDIEGTSGAMRFALEDAGLTAGDIGYINAHGTATVLNDQIESASVRLVFGDNAPPVSSTKPIHGHTLGAAGAIELAITVMALREQIMPPTINWQVEDPGCPVDCVPNIARRARFTAAMSNSFAFGGINSCLIVKEAA